MNRSELYQKWIAKKLDYREAAVETGNDTVALVMRAKAQVCEELLADLCMMEEADDGK